MRAPTVEEARALKRMPWLRRTQAVRSDTRPEFWCEPTTKTDGDRSLIRQATRMPWSLPAAKMSTADRDMIEQLLARGDEITAQVRDAFLQAIDEAGNRIDVQALADLLRQGRTAEAIEMVHAALVAAGFTPISAAITSAVVDVGQAAAAAIPVATGAPRVTFSQTDPVTVQALRQYEFDLIRELTDETRAAVADTVRVGMDRAQNPIVVARDIKQSIGLTRRQNAAVGNFRRMLEELDGQALTRDLRDGRYDAALARAIRNNEPLKPDQIDAMVAAYYRRYKKYRAETIARTEATRAVNRGNHEAWRQAIDDGSVDARTIVRQWVYTHDKKTRHAHRLIPGMNSRGVAFDKPFKSIFGAIMFPGDPKAPPENTVNCRCTIIVKIDPLRAIVDEGEDTGTGIGHASPEDKLLVTRPAIEARVLEEGLRTKVENQRVIDLATGEEAPEMYATGTSDNIKWTPAIAAAFGDPSRSFEAHHNHPSDHSLSGQDLGMLATRPGLKRVYALGHLGSRYWGEDAVPNIYALNGTADRALRAVARREAGPASSLFATYDDSIVQRYLTHARVKALADAGAFKYGYELAPDLAAVIRDTQKRFDEIVAETAAAVRQGMAAKMVEELKAGSFPGFIDPPDFSNDPDVWRAFRANMAAIRPRTPDVAALIDQADEEIARIAAASDTQEGPKS